LTKIVNLSNGGISLKAGFGSGAGRHRASSRRNTTRRDAALRQRLNLP
jgi:hypothetical protein